MDLKDLFHEFVSTVTNMQLATVNEGSPWVCTVFFVADKHMNFYWTSGRSRQHSKEILQNPKAAATVVKDHVKKQAMQMAGEAYEVSNEDLERVHQLYMSKFGAKDYDLEEMKKHTPGGRSYWVFKPGVLMFWDEVNFPDSPKQQLNI